MAWKEASQNGNVYYYNEETGETRWDKPDELLTPLERALSLKGWKQSVAEDGKVYYYNETTQESRWDLPEEVQEVLDAESKNESQNDEGKQENDGEEAEVSKPSAGMNISSGTQLTDQREKYRNESSLLNNRISARTSHDAEAIFIGMLRENGVDATWSFSKIMDAFIQDPRYWVVEDSFERKQIFENFLNNRTKEELMKENMSVEKFKTAFLGLLKSKQEIVYYTRWKTARALIQDEPIYAHSVISEKVKKHTFQEYIDSLKQTHDAKENKLREQALSELNEYFKTMNLDLKSTWDSTLKTIKQDKRFEQNKHFEVLNQLDLITLFEENIRNLQGEYKSKIQSVRRLNYRSDRKARDAYKELLKELKESGLLRADTKWDEVYPLINEDDRFLGMLGRNGSTPFDLFNDLIEEEDLLIRAKKDIVEQILLRKKFVIKDDVNLDDQKTRLAQILSQDEKTKDYDDDTIELIHEKFLKDVKEQRQRDRFAEERRIKRLQEEFKVFLHGFNDPRVEIETKWEDIKPKLEKTAEYLALPNEQTRQAAYEKFIERLTEEKLQLEARKAREAKRQAQAPLPQPIQAVPQKRPAPAQEAVELDY